MADINLVTAAGSFGIGGGIALYLVYWMTQSFSKQMDANCKALDAIASKLVDHDKQAAEIKVKVCSIEDQLKEMRNN